MVDQYAVAVWEVNEWVGTATLKLHMEIMGGALSNHLCVPQTQLMPHEGQCVQCAHCMFSCGVDRRQTVPAYPY